MTLSQQWGERMRKVLAGDSSTRSTSPRLIPDEPGVIVRGKGCRVWDADGREYSDYHNALRPGTLGYQFPAVDDAIREQLDSGIIFGHPHPLEGEVAEMICGIIPCAERACFLKTGGGSCRPVHQAGTSVYGTGSYRADWV
ncbi:MAG: aminotransferase class III-fold pyridoxal phosphate-dependent enzyme [Anaerolineae bacterium]|nr:aminotransferase class III-fold pyridoxal phosphate-dependent enzyme [Anaerolineae bacterium]